jgi:hypothetical protein
VPLGKLVGKTVSQLREPDKHSKDHRSDLLSPRIEATSLIKTASIAPNRIDHMPDSRFLPTASWTTDPA